MSNFIFISDAISSNIFIINLRISLRKLYLVLNENYQDKLKHNYNKL